MYGSVHDSTQSAARRISGGMPKHTETVMIHDHKVRTARVFTLEVCGPQLVIDALEEGCLNMEILANAVANVTERKCLLEVRVIQKDRNGKLRRKQLF